MSGAALPSIHVMGVGDRFSVRPTATARGKVLEQQTARCPPRARRSSPRAARSWRAGLATVAGSCSTPFRQEVEGRHSRTSEGPRRGRARKRCRLQRRSCRVHARMYFFRPVCPASMRKDPSPALSQVHPFDPALGVYALHQHSLEGTALSSGLSTCRIRLRKSAGSTHPPGAARLSS